MPTTQMGIPVPVPFDAVEREKSLGGALELCAKLAGFDLDKELQQTLGVDKGQFSRWGSGTEGILWHKFVKLMDACGNDAPLFWMLHSRGYDLASVRRKESETERALRIEQEKVAALEMKVRVLVDALQGRTA